ncbi:MAG: ABC transporter ATP-binding protein [Desulfobacteraceae bacterium]|nr:ABC transporter ATP-binding protein [Desulfobacteraceae bacterium]
MLISISNLTKSYKTRHGASRLTVLSDFNLDIGRGESFGFLGPNGAGKSTLIKILMDFIRYDSGTITIEGKAIASPDVRKKIGYLPENPTFYSHLTAEEILKFGGKIAGIKTKELNRRIDELLVRLNLIHAKKQKLRTYSKGMVQRTGIAYALVHDPEICIFDEPMSGLDPMGRKLISDLIIDMRNQGKTIFFSSHILSDVEKLCDRIGILNKGQLLYCGSLKDFTSNNDDIETAFVNLIETDNGKQV